jgi:hypothetical protein
LSLYLSMTLAEFVWKKITALTERIYNESSSVSQLLIEAKTLAKLRGDFDNLLWIELEFYEIVSLKNVLIPTDIQNKFSQSELGKLKSDLWLKWVKERKIDVYDKDGKKSAEEMISTDGLLEIESKVKLLALNRSSLKDTGGMAPLDKYYTEQDNFKTKILINLQSEEYSKILRRIRNRVLEYVNSVETDLVAGKVLSNYFENNRIAVEKFLKNLSSDFENHLLEIQKRLGEQTSLSYSQGLLLVRVLLKKYADLVYPSSAIEVKGFDGKLRILGEAQYISRIWQYLYEMHKTSTQNMLHSQLRDLGNRIEQVYEKSCKGVHDSVNIFEANQCVIQMYLSFGDIMRVVED